MPEKLTIKVKLPTNRDKTGTLELIDPFTGRAIFGPVPVLGRAAKDTATAHGNPTRNPTKSHGHTPLGKYDVQNIVTNGPGTPRTFEVYGGAGSIVLDPVAGEAATAKANGRTGLLIHAGRQPNSPTPLPLHLKTTNGCIRMLERDLATLIQKIKDNTFLFPGTVAVEVGPEGPIGGIDESAIEGDPPPTDGGDIILP